MNERIAAIRSLVMRSTGIPDPENQKLRAGALDQTTHKSEVIREAKAIVHYFDNRDLVTNVEPNRSDFVFSRKSSPAFLAWDKWRPEAVFQDLSEARLCCTQHRYPVEFILKDISTVLYQPQRLWEWVDTAMKIVNG